MPQWELLQGQSEITESAVIMAARLAGLDVEQLRRDMTAPAIATAIDQNRILARELGIESPPAVILGQHFYRGPIDLEHLQFAVAQARRDPAL